MQGEQFRVVSIKEVAKVSGGANHWNSESQEAKKHTFIEKTCVEVSQIRTDALRKFLE